MRNLEGIRFTEIPENEMENRSLRVNESIRLDNYLDPNNPKAIEDENLNFDDCALTDDIDKLKNLKQALQYSRKFDTHDPMDFDETYDDCKKL